MTFDSARTREVTDDLDRHLRGMPYHDYLVAMLGICGLLQENYKTFLSKADVELTTRTLDLLRSWVAEQPDVPAAQTLSAAWINLLDQPDEDGPEGWFAAMYTFQFVAAELAGEMPSRTCLEYLSRAAKELPDPSASTNEPKLVRLRGDSPPEGRAAEELLMKIARVAKDIAIRES